MARTPSRTHMDPHPITLADQDHPEHSPPGRPDSPLSDAAALDAYSRSIIHVVDIASPALIALRGPRASHPSHDDFAPASDADQPPRGGSGSGFLIAPDGFAVTNSHVVGGRSRLTAITAEGDHLDARVIGDDPSTDIAVVRVSARELPTVRLSDDLPPRVGQLVVAMGSPFGLEATVSAGIVSAMNRSMRGIGGRLIDGVVQHTAPINPGNSGGPLLDSRGLVIGVNTAAIAFAQAVGFAVPAGTVRWVVGELMAHGRVARPTLGIAVANVTIPRRLIRALDLLGDQGVLVRAVESRTPAAAAGLREGDVIVEFEDRVITGIDDLHRLLSRMRPAAPITLTILRGEQRHTVHLTL